MDLDAVGSATAKFTGVLQHFIYHSDQLGEKVQMSPNAARFVAEPENGLLSNRIWWDRGSANLAFQMLPGVSPSRARQSRQRCRWHLNGAVSGLVKAGRPESGVLEERVPFLTSTGAPCHRAAIFNRIVYSVGNAGAHAVPLVRHCRAKGSDPRDAVVPWLSVSCSSPVQRTEVVFNRGQRDRKRGHPVYRTPTP